MIKQWTLLLLLFLAWPCWAAVTFDALTTSGGTGDFGDDTFSHTVAADANFLLVCSSTTVGTVNNNITSITYGGAALTQLLTAGTGNRVELWYKLAPATGANDVVVDANSDPFFVYTAISLKGVEQISPIHVQTAVGSGTTSAIIITSATGEYVIDCLTIANDPAPPTPGAGQTERVNTTHDGLITALISTMDGASPSVEPNWTFDAEYSFGHLAVSVAATAAAAASGKRLVIFP